VTAVVIPAHNEAAVIEQTLVALLGQAAPEDEIIVVCNGCSDDTAGVARRFAPRVTVLETDVPSKTNALNLGDRQARSFPRIYLDADVILAEGALGRLVRALESGRWLAVSPDPVMILEEASWPVRAYYDIWLSLPYCRSGMIGAGAYALSKTGRARFGDFPDVIADDGYVRALFTEEERGRVEGARSMVRAPASLAWLLKIKTRSRLGGMELALKFPGLLANEAKDYSGALRGMIANPLNWPKVLVYLYVNLVSRLMATRRLKNLSRYQWEKDLSSRSG
jgi:glycosyltransferase involved in cell wall biosynthesis